MSEMPLEEAVMIVKAMAEDYAAFAESAAIRTVLARNEELEQLLEALNEHRDRLGEIIGPKL